MHAPDHDHCVAAGGRGLDRLLAVLDTYYQSAGDVFGADLGRRLLRFLR